MRGTELINSENIIRSALFLSAASSTIIVFLIVAFMRREGIYALALGKDFIFGMEWNPSRDQFGIFPIIVSTFIVGLGSLLILAMLGGKR